jgi:hypothetical protein
MSADKHVFSEQETSQILQKAARLQEASSEDTYRPGVTREELERIAAEAGIDPKFVGKALLALEDEPKKSWLNLSESFERVIEGEVDPNDFDEIFRDLKPANNRMAAQQIGRTVTMQTFYGGAMCNVEISSRQGRTRVKVKSVPFVAYFLSLHPTLILGIVAGVNFGVHGNALIGLLVFAILSLLGITGFAALVKRGHRSARKLVDVLEKRVEDYTSQVRKNLAASPAAPVETSEQQQLSN